jgi:hypothetical protein
MLLPACEPCLLLPLLLLLLLPLLLLLLRLLPARPALAAAHQARCSGVLAAWLAVRGSAWKGFALKHLVRCRCCN